MAITVPTTCRQCGVKGFELSSDPAVIHHAILCANCRPPLPEHDDQTKELIGRWEAEGFIDPNCAGCEVFYRDPNAMAPRHRPSRYCQSGKRPHCTCDACW